MDAFNGKQFIIMVFTVLKHHYPDFYKLPENIPDHRQRRTYDIAEIIMAGLYIFIFKRGSRNNAEQGISDKFEDNYITLSGLRLPVMDTVNVFLKSLPPEELEKLKRILVQRLIENKVLSKFRYQGCYVVAVDGTGMFSYDYEPFPGCPHKTSKNGKRTWQAYVLEAKILCANKFSISIATEWLCNSDDIDQKQDCELKAFVRLSDKIKKLYPRLPIILAADALYPNQNVLKTCKDNNWRYIFTFKDGVLKTVWEEVGILYPLTEKQNKSEKVLRKDKTGWLKQSTMFINDIEYCGFILNWVEYNKIYTHKDQPEKRFVHITDMKINKGNVEQVSFHGRMRWKIENEGFNTQKNGGYNLQHKFSRQHFGAMQNYYQLLQIAHLIAQLTEKLKLIKQAVRLSGRTIMSLWEDIFASMLKEIFSREEIITVLENTKQLRY